MQIIKKSEVHFKQIESINYNNPHGGAYAYVQFLAYTRELIKLLGPIKKVEQQLDAIEGINWLFNECLVSKFTYHQQVIFDTKLNEMKEIFEKIRASLKELALEQTLGQSFLEKEAA
jgi:hypothetical protein